MLPLLTVNVPGGRGGATDSRHNDPRQTIITTTNIYQALLQDGPFFNLCIAYNI